MTTTRAILAMAAGWAVLGAVYAGADSASSASAQSTRKWDGQEYQEFKLPQPEMFPAGGFTFCRIHYTSYGEDPEYNTPYGRWLIDYPDSDDNFSLRLSQVTTINVAKDDTGRFRTATVRLTDEKLYNYPFIYMVEVGQLNFSEDEVTALRGYLLRGGFLMVDDFWGHREFANWEEQFARVFDPAEYPMKELPLTHPVFNCVFEIKEKPQVSNPWHWQRYGDTSERGEESAVVEYKGVFDKSGRMMAIICHNTDLGDGWERETMFEDYFKEMSVKRAYPMGINIVVYALTH